MSALCFFAAATMRAAPRSTSSTVVCLPTESRTVPTAYSSGTPIATSTPEMDAAAVSLWHAAPADAATSSLSASSRTLALTPLIPTDTVFGNRRDASAGPLKRTPETPAPDASRSSPYAPSSESNTRLSSSVHASMYFGKRSRSASIKAHAAPSDFPFSQSAAEKQKPRIAPVALDASLFSDHANVSVRTDLLDCNVDICAPEVLYLFTDNFDYQNIRRDFVVGTLNERELGNNIYAHFLEKSEYAVRVDSLRTYDAVSRDVVGRWTFPMTPDQNALPRGERSTYAHGFGNAYREKNVDVDATATIGFGSVIGEGCVVGAGSVVNASTLGRGVVIGKNCVVDGSYVQKNVVIHEGAVVNAAFLCEDVVVHAGAVVGKGAVLSYGVVVGAGHVVADYARLSLATQPAHDVDEYDSDEDGLEVGSLPSDGRRVSLGGSGSVTRGRAHTFGGRV